MMSFTIIVIVGENTHNSSIVSIKNLCLFQPMQDQDLESKHEFSWSKEKSKEYGMDESVIKPATQPNISKMSFRQLRSGRVAESMQNVKLPSKLKQPENKPTPERSPSFSEYIGVGKKPSPKTPGKTFLSRDTSLNKMILGSKKTINDDISLLQTKKKLSWLVDSSALLANPKLSQLASRLTLDLNISADEDQKKLRASLLRMESYFESLLRKIFAENKSRFLNMEYIKAIFQEELSQRRDRESKPVVAEDFFKFSPVSGGSLAKTQPINNLRESFGSARRVGDLPCHTKASPTVELKTQFTRWSTTKKHNTEVDTSPRHTNLVSNDLLRRRGGAVQISAQQRHVREWREGIVKLNFHDDFTVLVVDDNIDQIKVVSDILTQFKGVETEHASDGLEAVQLVKMKMQEGLMYHMVITDLIMPYNGYETTKDIRKMEKSNRTVPRYKVYGITGDLEDRIVDMNATKAGMDGTIQKPLAESVIKDLFIARAAELGLEFTFEYL